MCADVLHAGTSRWSRETPDSIVPAGWQNVRKTMWKVTRGIATLHQVVLAASLFWLSSHLHSSRFSVILMVFLLMFGGSLGGYALSQHADPLLVSESRRMFRGKTVLSGIVFGLSQVLFFYGLRKCGPAHAFVIMNCHQPVVHYLRSRRPAGAKRSRYNRGLLLVALACVVVIFDASNRIPSGKQLIESTQVGRKAEDRLLKLKSDTANRIAEVARRGPHVSSVIHERLMSANYGQGRFIEADPERWRLFHRKPLSMAENDFGKMELEVEDVHTAQNLTAEVLRSMNRSVTATTTGQSGDKKDLPEGYLDPNVYNYDNLAQYDDVSEEESMMKMMNPQLTFFDRHFESHQVVGVALIFASKTLEQASEPVPLPPLENTDSRAKLRFLRVLLATASLLPTAVISSLVWTSSVSYGPVLFLQIALVGFLWHSMIPLLHDVASAQNRSRGVRVMVEQIVPLVVVGVCMSVSSTSHPTSVSAYTALAFMLCLIGDRLIRGHERGNDLPVAVASGPA